MATDSDRGSRREVLKLLGGTMGATALAGCGGDGDSGETDSGSGGTPAGTLMDDVLDVEGTVPPTDLQFNPWNGNNYGGTRGFVYDLLVFYHPTEGELRGNVITDWELADGEVVAELREQQWHDGTEVTAEDLVVQFQILKHLDFGVWDFLTSVSADGDRTVVFELADEVNENLIIQRLFQGRYLNSKRDIFQEWVGRFEDADGDSEVEEIQAELLEMSLDEPLGNSPWMMNEDETSPSQGYYEVFEDHPVAGQLNYDLRRHADEETGVTQEKLIGDDLDAFVREATPRTLLDQLPDHFERWSTPQPYSMDYSFDHSHDVWGRAPARRAFAYLIDCENWVINAERELNYIPIETVTGIRYNAEEWVDDSFGQFTDYGPTEVLEDEAEREMERAGFTKEDGTWLKENGDPVTAEITTPSTNPTTKGGQTTVSVLEDFGIETELETRDTGSFIGQGWQEGDYTIGLWLSRFASTYHPYDNLYGSYQGTLAQANNFPSTVEVPMPVGDPDGEMTEIDLEERLGELVQSSENATEVITELAWVYNRLLPSLPMANVQASRILSNDHWEYDSENPLWNSRPENVVVYSGDLTAKTE